MALNQILCVQIAEKEDQVRSMMTCRIVDTTCDINITSWRKLSHASKNYYHGMHDFAKEVFIIELENSQYMLVVIPKRNESISAIRSLYDNTIRIMFLDPGLQFTYLLSCVRSHDTLLKAKVMWQGDDFSCFESVSGKGSIYC